MSAMSIFVLACLADRPMHAYGIRQYTLAYTFWQTAPHASSIRSALRHFERDGLIQVAWSEPGNASRHERVVYDITAHGRNVLWAERQALGLVSNLIDRVTARERALDNFKKVVSTGS